MFFRFYLFILRERGKEGEREGEKLNSTFCRAQKLILMAFNDTTVARIIHSAPLDGAPTASTSPASCKYLTWLPLACHAASKALHQSGALSAGRLCLCMVASTCHWALATHTQGDYKQRRARAHVFYFLECSVATSWPG